MCLSLYTIFHYNYASSGNLKTLPFYQAINTQELCALFLASSRAFCFDSLWNETLGLVRILSPFIKLEYFIPNTQFFVGTNYF
jgi:hypothetical protein